MQAFSIFDEVVVQQAHCIKIMLNQLLNQELTHFCYTRPLATNQTNDNEIKHTFISEHLNSINFVLWTDN